MVIYLQGVGVVKFMFKIKILSERPVNLAVERSLVSGGPCDISTYFLLQLLVAVISGSGIAQVILIEKIVAWDVRGVQVYKGGILIRASALDLVERPYRVLLSVVRVALSHLELLVKVDRGSIVVVMALLHLL